MNVRDFYSKLACRFRSAGFDVPETEASYVVSEVTGIRHNLVCLEKTRILTPEEEALALSYAERRLANEPYQYVFSWAQFRDLKLKVSPACLIPRPETETLVDLVLKALPDENPVVCEVGLGSGAISLAIATGRPDANVYASEISGDALAIALENRRSCGAERNTFFMAGDMFSPFEKKPFFDVIAANLPYIPYEEKANLPPNVRDYEPDLALFAGDKGTALIRRLLLEAPPYLKDGGKVFLEMGEEQGETLKEAAVSSGFWKDVRVEKDLFGLDRFLVCTLSSRR